MFTRGELTRRSGADPRALTYAVIDLETTGLNPNRGSRVCELAIVRMRGDGVGLDEYSTLINPGMRINSDEYYVSHNLDHEEKFLVAEFGRLGVNLSDVPGLCSLVTARTQIDSWGYKLEYVHHLVTGEWLDAVHSALGDARALAVTLTKFVNEAPQRLSWIGPQPAPIPVLPRTGIVAPRAAGLRKGTEGWLATHEAQAANGDR
ncbi:3'-5' exonuclease [Micromonospora sp. LOL_014]|uniref:3'-5' exonuclease n=1 Tax=Micromonospora sp. LOL_014 TaxID=3345415 RepID=UPI003A8A7FF5